MGLEKALKQEERANELLKQQQEFEAARMAANTPPAAPAAPPQEAPPKQDDATWEARYKVLDGKYRAEVPRMAAQNRELSERLADSVDKLRELSDRVAKFEAQNNRGTLVKKEEVDQYGEGMLDVVRRAAREELDPELKAKDAKIAELESRVQSVSNEHAKSKSDSFTDALSKEVPNWRVINDDAAFHAWLLDVNPETQMARQDALDVHAANKDAVKVGAIFKEYLRQTQTRAADANSGMQQMLTPSGGSAPEIPGDMVVLYTRDEIRKAYEDIRAGRITGDKATALEADIDLALREGRIVG